MNLPVISVVQLRRALVTLKPGRFNYLVNGYLKIPVAWRDCLSVGSQLKLCLADWLTHLGCIDEGQQERLLKARSRRIIEFAVFLAEAIQGEMSVPGFTLTISDGRYVSVLHDQSWYDLLKDEEFIELPEPCVTHLVCDVTALYMRLLKRIRQLSSQEPGGTDVTDPHGEHGPAGEQAGPG